MIKPQYGRPLEVIITLRNADDVAALESEVKRLQSELDEFPKLRSELMQANMMCNLKEVEKAQLRAQVRDLEKALKKAVNGVS